MKCFGENQAVRDLSLAVHTGQIYGLMGPDGAGKTTTMRLLCGALRADAGELFIAGIPLLSHPDRAREKIGYLSQQFSLYDELTVLENIRFFAEVRGISSNEWFLRAREILEFVGLADFMERRAGNLSGGMKQKLGLAAALVHRPEILLLDEPTGGVDPVTRQDFWQLLIRLVAEESISVLVSTPYMDEASRCTVVGFMKDGLLVIEDQPDRLRQRLEGRIIEVVGRPIPDLRKIAERHPDVESVQTFREHLHLRAARNRTSRVIRYFHRNTSKVPLELELIQVVPPTLEDVFIELLDQPSGKDPGAHP
jgi:ABC-2 type transport system ATP-binding protein